MADHAVWLSLIAEACDHELLSVICTTETSAWWKICLKRRWYCSSKHSFSYIYFVLTAFLLLENLNMIDLLGRVACHAQLRRGKGLSSRRFPWTFSGHCVPKDPMFCPAWTISLTLIMWPEKMCLPNFGRNCWERCVGKKIKLKPTK